MTQERLADWPKQCARCEFWGEPYKEYVAGEYLYGTCHKGHRKGYDVKIGIEVINTKDKTHWAFNCEQFKGAVVPF